MQYILIGWWDKLRVTAADERRNKCSTREQQLRTKTKLPISWLTDDSDTDIPLHVEFGSGVHVFVTTYNRGWRLINLLMRAYANSNFRYDFSLRGTSNSHDAEFHLGRYTAAVDRHVGFDFGWRCIACSNPGIHFETPESKPRKYVTSTPREEVPGRFPSCWVDDQDSWHKFDAKNIFCS